MSGVRVIAGGKGSGKTTKLIEMCAEEGGYIVCHDRDEAARVLRLAVEMGYDIPLPITFEEFVDQRYYARGVDSLHIDNLFMLLNRMSLAPIKTATFSLDEVYIKE